MVFDDSSDNKLEDLVDDEELRHNYNNDDDSDLGALDDFEIEDDLEELDDEDSEEEEDALEEEDQQ